jgi:hypothetical protein
MLRAITQGIDEETRAILPSFIELVSEKIEFIPQFATWGRHLKRHFPNDRQQRVVQALKELLPDSVSQSSGKTWWGYYFRTTPPKPEPSGWFGYVESNTEIVPSDPSSASRARSPAELILTTSFPLTLDQRDFLIIPLTNTNWLSNGHKQHARAINYDESWNSLEYWRAKLAPLTEKWQRRVAGETDQSDV